MSPERSSSQTGPHRSSRTGRARSNMQGCGTCRIRKKLCPGPSHNGDCQACLALRVECLHCYHQPVPEEFRAKKVIEQLTIWHRRRSTRAEHDKLSLTQFVLEQSTPAGPRYLAPPGFSSTGSQPSTLWNHPYPYSDQHIGLSPLMSNSPTPSGSYRSDGSPPRDGVSELGDSLRTLDVGGGSPAIINTTYSPDLTDVSAPPCETYGQPPESYPPIAEPAPIDLAFGEFGVGGYHIADFSFLPDFDTFRTSPSPYGWPMTGSQMAAPVHHNRVATDTLFTPDAIAGSHQLYDSDSSMQRTVYSHPPSRQTVCGDSIPITPPMHSPRRRTDPGPNGISPTRTYAPGPNVPHSEISKAGTGPRLSGARYPEIPNLRVWTPDVHE